MADDDATRVRRYRRHRQGVHALCRPQVCPFWDERSPSERDQLAGRRQRNKAERRATRRSHR
jgi:hypothetical protein